MNLAGRIVVLFCTAALLCVFVCPSGMAALQTVDEKNSKSGSVKQKEDASIVLTEPFKTRRGLTVENGIAFEEAKVQLKNFKKLIVPKDATIRAEGEPGTMLIYMAKTLGFVGQTPQPMSIRELRKNMNCAIKSEAGTDTLIVATFGVWDSHIEGGAKMKLVLVVPKDIEVERRANLSGENSVAIDRRLRMPTRAKAGKQGATMNQVVPASGWEAVAFEPDPKQTAK